MAEPLQRYALGARKSVVAACEGVDGAKCEKCSEKITNHVVVAGTEAPEPFLSRRIAASAVKIVSGPQIGSSPGAAARPRLIVMAELTDSTRR
jgi:hypothetical protein